MTASALPYAEIALGESFKPIATFRTSAGVAYNLSLGTVSVVCRLIKAGGSVITRTMGVSGEYAFPTDGTDGKVQFLFAPGATAGFDPGDYDVEVIYTETSATPDDKVLTARGRLKFYNPRTAPI